MKGIFLRPSIFLPKGAVNTLLQGPWWLVLPAGFREGETGKWVYQHARKIIVFYVHLNIKWVCMSWERRVSLYREHQVEGNSVYHLEILI